MYARSYYGDGEGAMNLPDNYVGEAFSDGERARTEENAEVCEECTQANTDARESGGIGGILASLGLPFLERIRMPRIGSEELLIIAAAAFLLLSKDGDRECAVMLLLLLFIR